MNSIIRLTRPYQWIKNVFVFMPMFFGGHLFDGEAWLLSVAAFLAFSFVASSIYCYNDIIDVADDRRHSVKCKRPIASGRVTIGQGYALHVLMLALAVLACFIAGGRWAMLLAVIMAYYVLDICYCRWLKRLAIVDVFVLSFGFVLRIFAGSTATGIMASHWLVLMTFLLTLLLGFAKRRDDVERMLRFGEAPRHNTKRYSITFINHAVTVTAAVTVVCYIMYTMSLSNPDRPLLEYAYLTTVFVLLGLFRYMQLADIDGKTGDPTKLLYRDHFLQLTILLWIISYAVLLYM